MTIRTIVVALAAASLASAAAAQGARPLSAHLTGAAENTDPVCTLSPNRGLIDEAIGEREEPLEYRYRVLAGEPQQV